MTGDVELLQRSKSEVMTPRPLGGFHITPRFQAQAEETAASTPSAYSNTLLEWNRQYPLHLACRCHHYDVAYNLLEDEADLSKTDQVSVCLSVCLSD